jgi:uncharacterized membrane protein YedE/YeeE
MDLTAIALGVAFGFCLERGGMAYAPKLAGQFTGTDFTVLRVMFSAIITAMLGIFWLDRLGLIDAAAIYVPDTHLPAQALGGVVFGSGFAVAGLCPGTSCVAAATGRLDGLAVMAGLILGVLVFHEGFAVAHPLYDAAPLGPQTLPAALGIPYGVVVCLVVLLALVVFGVSRTLERQP